MKKSLFFFYYTKHIADQLGIGLLLTTLHDILCFQTALVIICSSHFRNKSISSEGGSAHFIHSSDQRLDQTTLVSTGQRFVSLLN